MKKTIGIFATLFILLSSTATIVSADTTIDNGINYLKTNQATTGQIMGGSTGDASPWAAIAFAANGIDISTIKQGNTSLLDYLQTNHPSTTAQATEWEKWILAITASRQNPYNFGGINYVGTLESSQYYISNQLGDATSATDDWFGVLALIASGVNKNDVVLNNSLSFVLAHQNTDGGFGYATSADSDGNDTAAAIQALVAAKNYGLPNTNLDAAISNAKTYLLTTQATNGGFQYDTNPWTTSPDSDSTTWALMALNVLGMSNTSQTTSARTWLLSQQATNGGFTACNQWDPNTFACTGYAANTTTTSHALIGLAGKGWLLKIFDASNISPTPTSPDQIGIQSEPTPVVSTAITPSPTPSTASKAGSSATPTALRQGFEGPAAITPSVTPTPSSPQAALVDEPSISPITPSITINQPNPTKVVLGVHTTRTQAANNSNRILLFSMFVGFGVVFLGAYGLKKIMEKKVNIL